MYRDGTMAGPEGNFSKWWREDPDSESSQLVVRNFQEKLESAMTASPRTRWAKPRRTGKSWQTERKLFSPTAPSKVAFGIKPKQGHFSHKALHPRQCVLCFGWGSDHTGCVVSRAAGNLEGPRLVAVYSMHFWNPRPSPPCRWRSTGCSPGDKLHSPRAERQVKPQGGTGKKVERP